MSDLLWKVTTGLHVWTDGTFNDKRILLQIDTAALSSDCYVNANDPRSLFTSYSITIRKQDGVVSENCEVMQDHRGVNFQAIF